MSERGVAVREAGTDEALAVRRVLDAAMLETGAVSDAVARGDALVAVDDASVVGALVLVPPRSVELPDAVAGTAGGMAADADGEGGMHVDAVAVRRRRRGQGVGRALVEAALARERRLSVAFDPAVAPFYDALGFETVVDVDGDGRRRATRTLEA